MLSLDIFVNKLIAFDRGFYFIKDINQIAMNRSIYIFTKKKKISLKNKNIFKYTLKQY